MKGIAIIFSIFLTLGLLLATVSSTMAIDVSVEGNGSGSSNQVNINQSNQNNVNQNNQANIDNNVDANCNTGGNSASGNTGANAGVNTGNCQTNVDVSNQVNSNQANISCPTCPKPSVSPKPSASPTPGQSVGGPGGGPGGGGNGGGPGGGDASNPQVLAAAGTSLNQLITLAGIGLISIGLWQLHVALRKVKASN